MGAQLAMIGEALGPPSAAEGLPRLPALYFVPPGHGVAVLCGAVVIYGDPGLCRSGIQEGALYVIEHQRPAAGMGAQSYHRESLAFLQRGEAAIRLLTEREVVQVARWARNRDLWQYTRASGFTEYPLHEWGLASMIVGRVVGVYAPARAEGAA